MKIYILLGALIASLLLLVYVQELKHDAAELRATIAENRKAAAEASLSEMVKQRDSESANRIAYLQQLEVAEHEIETLERDLDANRKRLSVRATCPRVPEAKSTRGTEEQTAELTPEAERNYIRLRKLIADQEAWIDFCHRTVLSWSY